MPFCIPALRMGVRIYIPGSGFTVNGNIEAREHCDYLTKEMGYRLKRCRGVPEWKPTEEELEEMVAADKMLGIHRGESGTTRIERGIKRGLRDIFEPLRRALRGEH